MPVSETSDLSSAGNPVPDE